MFLRHNILLDSVLRLGFGNTVLTVPILVQQLHAAAVEREASLVATYLRNFVEVVPCREHRGSKATAGVEFVTRN